MPQGKLRISQHVWSHSPSQQVIKQWMGPVVPKEITTNADSRGGWRCLLLDHPDFVDGLGEHTLRLGADDAGAIWVSSLHHNDGYNKTKLCEYDRDAYAVGKS